MHKLKLTASLLICAMTLCACGSPSVRLVQPKRMQADPLPAELAKKDTPNLVKTVQSSWSVSLPEATKASGSTPK